MGSHAEHHQAAERLLSRLSYNDYRERTIPDSPAGMALLAQAQVHATLAAADLLAEIHETLRAVTWRPRPPTDDD